MGPSSKMKVILRQGENLNTDMHTELMPCEDKGRDWSDASKSQRLLGKCQKLGESYGKDYTSQL